MHSAPLLRPLIEMYLAAFRAVARGPDADGSGEAAPRLDSWTPVLRGEQLCLIGEVTRHPRLRDTNVSTSALIHVTEDRRWARTLSRWYRLGAPFAVASSVASPNGFVDGNVVLLGNDTVSLPLHVARRITHRPPQLLADKAFEMGFDDLVPALTLLARTWPPVEKGGHTRP